MFFLDLQSHTPIYEQLKQRVSELVLVGALAPNEQLPSVRNLARELGINPNTVQKAYQELERDGILYSVSGRGSFVADAPARQLLTEQVRLTLLQALQQAARSGISRATAQSCLDQAYAPQNEKEGDNV